MEKLFYNINQIIYNFYRDIKKENYELWMNKLILYYYDMNDLVTNPKNIIFIKKLK